MHWCSSWINLDSKLPHSVRVSALMPEIMKNINNRAILMAAFLLKYCEVLFVIFTLLTWHCHILFLHQIPHSKCLVSCTDKAAPENLPDTEYCAGTPKVRSSTLPCCIRNSSPLLTGCRPLVGETVGNRVNQ